MWNYLFKQKNVLEKVQRKRERIPGEEMAFSKARSQLLSQAERQHGWENPRHSVLMLTMANSHTAWGEAWRFSEGMKAFISLSMSRLLGWFYKGSSVQFSSVVQSCPTLCVPITCSTPGLPVHHQVLEFTQTHVHRAGDDIQPSHPLPSPSPPAPNPSQHQGLFQWVNSLHELAKVLEFQLQDQSFQWTPRTDFL